MRDGCGQLSAAIVQCTSCKPHSPMKPIDNAPARPPSRTKTIALTRPTTIAQTLAASLERQIAEGAFSAGDKLPSLRELAELHGYAKNTVVAAFELLVERGLVEPRRGSGYYVVNVPKPHAAEEEAGSLGRAMDIVWLMREQLKSEPDQLSVGDGFPPVE